MTFLKIFVLFFSSLTVVSGPLSAMLMSEVSMDQLKNSAFFPFELNVPNHYLFMPLVEDTGFSEWHCLGEKSVILDMREQVKVDPDVSIDPISGVICMKLSHRVPQLGDKIGYETDEEVIEGLNAMGMNVTTIKTLHWGAYPVKVIEGNKATGTPVLMAWLGLNDTFGGQTILVSYFLPQNKSDYTKEKEIWNAFINESKEIPPEEYKERKERFWIQNG